MKPETRYLTGFFLGLVTLVVGLSAANLALFNWVERANLHYLLGDYARYVCAYGGFASMILGAMLVNDFLVHRKAHGARLAPYGGPGKVAKEGTMLRRSVDRKVKSFSVAFVLLFLSVHPLLVTSLVSYTATVVINPIAAANEYIWISGNDDFVRKLAKSDLSGPAILSWDTGTSQPFGLEHRIEDGNEYIYVTDCGTGQNADILIKFHANNGTEVSRWDISGYSRNGEGLAWNGSRWFIADRVDMLIYQVDPADPTTPERSFSYLGQESCSGLAWDGSYLWAVDFGTDKVYQIDIYGAIQTSWDFAPLNPRGIAYDPASGHLWIVNNFPYLYEFGTDGTEMGNWDPSGSMPQGVAYASVEG